MIITIHRPSTYKPPYILVEYGASSLLVRQAVDNTYAD